MNVDNFEAFIFDLDGTLLDTMSIWDRLRQEYLHKKGVTAIPPTLRETLKPMSLTEVADFFVTKFHLEDTAEQIKKDLDNIAYDKYKYEVMPKSGVVEFLEKNKIKKMCIATANEKSLVEYILSRLNLNKYFDFIMTTVDAGADKHRPDIFIQSARRLECEISKAIVFEDAPHAIKTAKTAGFCTIGVYEDFFKEDQMYIAQTADYYIRCFSELIK